MKDSANSVLLLPVNFFKFVLILFKLSLTSYNDPIFLEILFTVYLMWSFHERFSSDNTQRNLIDRALSLLQLFIQSLGNFSRMSSFLLVLWKNRESLLARNHWLILLFKLEDS